LPSIVRVLRGRWSAILEPPGFTPAAVMTSGLCWPVDHSSVRGPSAAARNTDAKDWPAARESHRRAIQLQIVKMREETPVAIEAQDSTDHWTTREQS